MHSITAPFVTRLGTDLSVFTTSGDLANPNVADYRHSGSGWTSAFVVGGGCGVPAAASWNASRQDVFCNATAGHHMWHQYYQDGVWGSWEDLGGVLDNNSPVAVASWGVNRLDVFGIAQGHVWHLVYDNGPWAWENLQGDFKLTGLTAVSTGPSKLEVFGVHSTGLIYTQRWDGHWSGWASFGVPPGGLGGAASYKTNALTAAVDPLGQATVFVHNSQGTIYQKTRGDGTDWSPIDTTGKTIPNTLTAVTNGQGIDLFAGLKGGVVVGLPNSMSVYQNRITFP